MGSRILIRTAVLNQLSLWPFEPMDFVVVSVPRDPNTGKCCR